MTTAAGTEAPTMATVEARPRRRRLRGTAGVVMVEYAFLLVFFAVPVMLATAAAGIKLIQVYGDIRNDTLHEFP
jgi:hypothetical protein